MLIDLVAKKTFLIFKFVGFLIFFSCNVYIFYLIFISVKKKFTNNTKCLCVCVCVCLMRKKKCI